MNDKRVTIDISGSFSTLLLIAFIILKLCNVIDWSWWWVLAPMWIPLAIILVGFIITLIIRCFFAFLS